MISLTAYSQTNPLKTSCLSSGIGSSTYLQTIGQSSVVIGTKEASSNVIRQRFFQTSAIENRYEDLSVDDQFNSLRTQYVL